MMATELVKETNLCEAAFRRARQDPGVNEPSWLQSLRENSFEQFERGGLPNVKQEEWKYTNVASIAKANFAPAVGSNGTAVSKDGGADELASFIYEEARQSRLIFVNGILRKELSSLEALPEGVVALDLRAALRDEEYEATLREYLEHPLLANGFAALNTALFTSGLLLKIPRGVKVEAPIHLLFIGEAIAGNPAPAAFPRVLILAEEDRSATIIESYATSQDDCVYLTNAIVRLNLADGAQLKHYKIQRESMGAFHVAMTRAEWARTRPTTRQKSTLAQPFRVMTSRCRWITRALNARLMVFIW